MSRSVFNTTAADSGTRVDVFLVRQGFPSSRASIQRWIEEGRVRLNGETTKPSYKLRPGDVVEVQAPAEAPASDNQLEPWDFPITILYEDDHLLAVSKPAGVVTHPGAGNRNRTLVHAIIVQRPQLSAVGHVMRPGVVHRLDRETSGVLLLAKTEAAYLATTRMFKDRRIEKHYRALTFGLWVQREGRIDTPLGRDPRDRKKISTRARKSRTAVTLYRVLQQGGCGAFLDVQILTGRTHQIRVHLSSENHPIVGDARYGGANWSRIPNPQLRALLKSSEFFGLHAFSLSFSHPVTAEPVHVECPLPDTWNDALKIL